MRDRRQRRILGARVDSDVAFSARVDQSKIDIELCSHHSIEAEMFAHVSETVLAAACGKIFVGKEKQDCGRERVAVVRLDDQSVFAVNNDLGNVADSSG